MTRALALLLFASAAFADNTPPIAPGGKSLVKGAIGSWRLANAKTITDSCGTRVILAAQHVTVAAGSLFADVVNRTYKFLGSADGPSEYAAEFSENNPDICPGTNLREVWRLDFTRKHGLLSSSWSFPPDCNTQCTVVFEFDLKKTQKR
jgi:hypothetical protein